MIVWELDLQTRRFTHVSGRVVSMLGYSPESWRERPGLWIGVVHPEDRARVAHAVWRAAREAGSCEIEYRAVAVDGRVVRVRDRVRTVSDETGHGRLLRGSSLDLSDPGAPSVATTPAHARPRRRTDPPRPDAAPPRADGQLILRAGLLDALGEAVIASDLDHRIVYWNRAAETLLGWAPEEALGRPDTELLPARSSRQQNAAIIAGVVHGRPWSAEVEVRNRHGIVVPVLMTVSPVRAEDSVPAGIVAVIADLRRLRSSEVKARRSHLMDVVARMAGGIAADLERTRDRIERSAKQLLADLPHTDPRRADAEEVYRATDALSVLTGELHSVARARPGDAADVDLNETVVQALPLIRVICGERVALRTDLGSAPIPVRADARHITQVILNIAANACSAMSATGQLSLRTADADLIWPLPGGTPAPAGNYVVLELRDSRPALPADAIDALFEPYPASPDEPGLRLTVAHALVTQNGGHIMADSAPDGGLVFRIYLPRAQTPS